MMMTLYFSALKNLETIMNNKNKRYENSKNPERISDVIRREYPLLAERLDKISKKFMYEKR